jgi:hypothetical protein
LSISNLEMEALENNRLMEVLRRRVMILEWVEVFCFIFFFRFRVTVFAIPIPRLGFFSAVGANFSALSFVGENYTLCLRYR